MKTLSLFALPIIAVLSCTNSGSSHNEQDSWTNLINGDSLSGWHSYGKSEAGAAWSLKDGVLHFDATAKKQGAAGGDLLTDEEYDNFHLQLEWKISKNGNSGIIFYVHEDVQTYPETYNTGLEMQVLDNDGHPDGKIHKHRAGDLYDLIPSKKETVNAPGSWNKVDIISDKGQLEFRLNGVTVVATTLWDDEWKSLVSRSKFASMPGFSTYKKGKIALQDHGDEVWYRNIRIRKL